MKHTVYPKRGTAPRRNRCEKCASDAPFTASAVKDGRIVPLHLCGKHWDEHFGDA